MQNQNNTSDRPIIVIDGQGGGLGRSLVKKLKEVLPQQEVLALGTNSFASSAMLQYGADAIATGENAILWNVKHARVIVGGVGIIAANSMSGEISPAMAEAISSSAAVKFLVPLSRCHIKIAGASEFTLPDLVERVVQDIKAFLEAGDVCR